MQGEPFSPGEFVTLLRGKPRALRLTRHAQLKSETLFLPESAVRADLEGQDPLIVFEQTCDTPHERQFNVYYRQAGGLYHRYVLTLNNEIRVITVIRSSKDFQKRFSR